MHCTSVPLSWLATGAVPETAPGVQAIFEPPFVQGNFLLFAHEWRHEKYRYVQKQMPGDLLAGATCGCLPDLSG